MKDVDRAVRTLAQSLIVPCDIITVHRQHSRRSRTKEFQSLRYGALLLALAAFDRFLTEASGFGENSGRALGLQPDRINTQFEKYRGIKNIVGSWKARTRVASQKLNSSYKRAPWYLFEGGELRAYLQDLHVARNLLAHGGDLARLTNGSGALHPLSNGGWSIRLMTVEGAIQAIEDMASQTALMTGGDEATLPAWPAPVPTQHGLTGRLSRPY